MRTARIFFCQQCQLFAGPIVRTQVVVAERQKVQGIGRGWPVGVQFHNLLKAMGGSEIRAPPIIEFPHKEMRLRHEVVAFLDLQERWAVIPASWKVFPQPFKGLDGFLNGAWVTLDSLGQFHLALSDAEHRIGGQDVGAVELEEMAIFDDSFRILLFLEKRLSPLHDNVGVVVLFDRIAHENLLVGAAERLLRGLLRFWCAGAGCDETECRDTEAEGHRHA